MLKIPASSLGNYTYFTLMWMYTRKCLLAFKSLCREAMGVQWVTQWHCRPFLYFSFLSKWPHTCNTLISTNAATHKAFKTETNTTLSTLCIHTRVCMCACIKPLSLQALWGSPKGSHREPRLCFPSQIALAQLQCQHTTLQRVTLTPHCCEMQRLHDETHGAGWASWQFYRF